MTLFPVCGVRGMGERGRTLQPKLPQLHELRPQPGNLLHRHEPGGEALHCLVQQTTDTCISLFSITGSPRLREKAGKGGDKAQMCKSSLHFLSTVLATG